MIEAHLAANSKVNLKLNCLFFVWQNFIFDVCFSCSQSCDSRIRGAAMDLYFSLYGRRRPACVPPAVHIDGAGTSSSLGNGEHKHHHHHHRKTSPKLQSNSLETRKEEEEERNGDVVNKSSDENLALTEAGKTPTESVSIHCAFRVSRDLETWKLGKMKETQGKL